MMAGRSECKAAGAPTKGSGIFNCSGFSPGAYSFKEAAMLFDFNSSLAKSAMMPVNGLALFSTRTAVEIALKAREVHCCGWQWITFLRIESTYKRSEPQF